MACSFPSIMFFALACLLPLADAGALRGPASTTDALLQDLLQALEELPGDSSTPNLQQRQLHDLKGSLQPVFSALPRSAEGFLEPAAVRYLLHRYFINHQGWFVPTAGSKGEVANASLPEAILGRSILAASLTSRLAARGLALDEVAVLAAAVERLASEETAERLHAAYRLVGMTHLEEHAKDSDLAVIHQMYLCMYVMGFDFRTVTRAEMDESLADIHVTLPFWDEMQKWAKQVRTEVLAASPELRFSFQGQLAFLEALQHRYARWQDQDCNEVKEALKIYATPGTGRVPLDTFRAVTLPHGWTTEDTDEDLLAVGALDVTDPRQPSVIVPNYFDSQSNCDDPSKYYSVCCLSECDGLLGHLERKLGTPQAHPYEIIELVEQLPSSTIEAPRTLSPQLVKRLDGIATMHGGHAPLHGRLFRQWMHHAFPLECSFPHVSGGSTPPSAQPAEEASLQPSAVAAPLGNQAFDHQRQPSAGLVAADDAPVDELEEELPWLEEEELFLQSPAQQPRAQGEHSIRMLLRTTIMLTMAGCMVWRLGQILSPALVAMGIRMLSPAKYAEHLPL